VDVVSATDCPGIERHLSAETACLSGTLNRINCELCAGKRSWPVFDNLTPSVPLNLTLKSSTFCQASQTKQQLFTNTALIDWFLYPRRSVFTERCELDL
jgi:hypothetical protein